MSTRKPRASKSAEEIANTIREFKETRKEQIRRIIGQRPNLKFRSRSQGNYAKTIKNNEITICSGPAGTGKSMVAIWQALELLWLEDNNYYQIVLIKPAVEADEKLGFLPGSVDEKLSVYVYSSVSLIEKIIGEKACKELIDGGFIKIQALAYIRGVSFDNSLLVLEEAQNTTTRQMKTLLTRIGDNSKYIISGDLEQSDKFKDTSLTGLFDAQRRLKDIEGVGICEFGPKDIVRNPIITKILEKYNERTEPMFIE